MCGNIVCKSTHYIYTVWKHRICLEKEVKDDIIFKELGSLQEKALFFLAENPENHKQEIQQGISHPTDQYASIKNAVDMLEKFGYLESKKIASQKNVQIKIYHCTHQEYSML